MDTYDKFSYHVKLNFPSHMCLPAQTNRAMTHSAT